MRDVRPEKYRRWRPYVCLTGGPAALHKLPCKSDERKGSRLFRVTMLRQVDQMVLVTLFLLIPASFTR
ncbi:hypothetical protein LDENG_00112070 [Lucifuga dentata]|nr:hypothetical protein LDENG_00112070 [Lucifuga dentata]